MDAASVLQENQRLKTRIDQISKQHEEHIDQLSKQHAKQLSIKQERIRQLEEMLLGFRRERFGSSSEQLEQLQLFNEAEAELEQNGHTDTDTLAVKAHRKRAGRPALPPDLPREEIIHELPEEVRRCPHDGSELIEIGEETSEQLEIIPAQVKVLRHIRKKYACPCCEKHIVTAPKPQQPIPKSIATAGLLAYIITGKYQDALPLYRQSSMFERIGVKISRTTLAEWVIRSGELVQPLINTIQERILEQSYIHMDETPVQVLTESGKAAQSKSYMWVQSAGPPNRRWVFYHYAPTRNQTVPQQLLSGYQGALMVDGYSGYNASCGNGIRRLGCWAHARRKFHEAKKAQPKGKTGKADQALSWIQQLYRIERDGTALKAEQRHQLRQQQALPILEKLRKWLDKSLLTVPPKTALGKALRYCSEQWPYLTGYLENSIYPIDNNPVENAIRPFAVGRKNWLFANSEAGAKASANLYSLIETAKAQGLEPYAYLKYVLERLPNIQTIEDVEALLPEKVKGGV